jgi:hypothetical protein
MSREIKQGADILIREGFWTGLGQVAAYSIIGLISGLVLLALLPDDMMGCPPALKPAPTDKAGCGCGCGGR